MSEAGKASHPPLPPKARDNANVFMGPGQTNLGVGPVIPDDMPQSVRQSYNDDRQPQRKPSQGTPGTGAKPTHTDGRARLGSDADERAERPQVQQQPQEKKLDPFRGPMGMSTNKKPSFGTPGTGPKPNFNADGRSRLGSDAEDHFSFEDEKEPKAGQEGGANNPWRGPGGMKLGHGPRVDHLEKNDDGSMKLKKMEEAASGPQGE